MVPQGQKDVVTYCKTFLKDHFQIKSIPGSSVPSINSLQQLVFFGKKSSKVTWSLPQSYWIQYFANFEKEKTSRNYFPKYPRISKLKDFSNFNKNFCNN